MITPPKIKTQNQPPPKTIHKTTKNPQNKEKNRKMTEQIIPQEQIDKSENRKTTRLRNQPRKNYKIFIPQSKILKKVEISKVILILYFTILKPSKHFSFTFFKITC